MLEMKWFIACNAFNAAFFQGSLNEALQFVFLLIILLVIPPMVLI